jgi:uncharacterized protein (DUF362 family)/Pyruvate/2-oxoacid:ferredoxin oxidoreductase delta subunit
LKSKVCLLRCDEYDYDLIKAKTDEAFALLGGIKRYIQPGMRVLIKPNLVRREKPENHATTHPLVIRAIADSVIKAGAVAVIAESPGGIYSKGVLKSLYETTGMRRAAEEAGAFLNYDCGVEEVFFPEGRQLNSFRVIRPVLECDAVITAAKLKTHEMMAYSGATKNLFGIIPGLTKTEYHYRMSGPEEFANMLVDIAEYAKPVLSVIDAIWSMEGEGPCSGDPRKTGALIFADNPYSADIAALRMIGLDIQNVPVIRHAIKRNLADLSGIQLLGDAPESLSVKNFKMPMTLGKTLLQNRVPDCILKPLERTFVLRPEAIKSKCVDCGTCASLCPSKAIFMKEYPVFDYERCINCYCCQEMCPQKAVKIRRPLIFRILTRLFK